MVVSVRLCLCGNSLLRIAFLFRPGAACCFGPNIRYCYRNRNGLSAIEHLIVIGSTVRVGQHHEGFRDFIERLIDASKHVIGLGESNLVVGRMQHMHSLMIGADYLLARRGSLDAEHLIVIRRLLDRVHKALDLEVVRAYQSPGITTFRERP